MGQRKGYKQSNEHIQRRSLSLKKAHKEGRHTGGFKKGNKLPRFKNHNHTDDFKKKQSDLKKINNPMFDPNVVKKVVATKKRLGIGVRENHWRWKGGISSENSKIRGSVEYKQWRKAVFERDNYTCQKCGARSCKGNYVYITAHHKKQFSEYPELRLDVSNGETLCIDCHSKETKHEMLGNHKGKRKYGRNK